MNINLKALEALELKLAEYRKENGAIAEHESSNQNSCSSGCTGLCTTSCSTSCKGGCYKGCWGSA